MAADEPQGAPSQPGAADQPLNADDLRWLGEAADGRRGEDLTLVRTGATLRLVTQVEATRPGNETLGINVLTPFEGNGLKKSYGTVSITIDGVKTDLKNADGLPPDTIFLTQSSVGKFVLPYYTRFKTPEEIGVLKQKLFGDDVLCAMHFNPSISDVVKDRLGYTVTVFSATGAASIDLI